MESSEKNIKLTDREIACIVWNTMYSAERKPFDQISEGAKDEWEKFVKITRMVDSLNGNISNESLQTIKNFQKL